MVQNFVQFGLELTDGDGRKITELRSVSGNHKIWN